MSPGEARARVLRAELARDWEQVRVALERARSTDPGAGPHAAAYVALALDHAYQAFETLLVRIETHLGLPARHGDGWHRALLATASLDIEGLRPAVTPADAEDDWEALLRFRHWLRHAYGAELDPERLRPVTARLARAVEAADRHVRLLVDSLP